MEDLRYPIGRQSPPQVITPEMIEGWITDVQQLPRLVREAVGDLSEERLNTPYRPEGWTVRQVVHHLADSHMNAFVRFKLALTEENPTVKPYDENRWVQLVDSAKAPIEEGITTLDGLHSRWTRVLKSMTADEFTRTLYHPEAGAMRLDQMLAMYAWHGRHHTAHITSLRQRMGW